MVKKILAKGKIVLLAVILCALSSLFTLAANNTSKSAAVPFPTSPHAFEPLGSAVPASAALTPSQNGSEAEQYYFPRAGQKAQPELLQIIGSSKKTLDVAIYCFTDQDIASALIQAKKRGVAVRLISDHDQSTIKTQKNILNSLKKAGIPIKVNSHSGIMHLKITIADQAIATTGSFNYTKSAETVNDEVFIVLKSADAAGKFENEFERLWNDKKAFASY